MTQPSTLDAQPSTALYRAVSLVLAGSFGSTGLVFLVAPGQVNVWLAAIGLGAGEAMPAADLDSGLFRALAGAYMYLVTVLAWLMFRRPAEAAWPTLLAHAKLASAVLSFTLFAAHRPHLIYVVNGVVDGFLGALALGLRRLAVRAAGEARRPRQGGPAHPPGAARGVPS